jgi:hypothetical protein
MRTKILAAFALAAAAVLFAPVHADAQVYSGYNPYTNRVFQGQRTYNPYRGGVVQSERMYNPATGTTTLARRVVNPFTGYGNTQFFKYNPLTNRYGYRYRYGY